MNKHEKRQNEGSEYAGNITCIRAVEDCIRATHKYTEGIGTIRKHHPIQGEDFPSRSFCKFYEVYPGIDLSWDMPADEAIDWLWGDKRCINVMFKYDYRTNKASFTVKTGNGTVRELVKTIPGFGAALEIVKGNGNTA